MYERLPLDFIGVTDKFGYRNDPTSGTEKFHYGVDLGWHSYQGEPIYAIYDSEVIYEAYDVNLGNYIVLGYQKDNKTIIYRFLHLKDRAIVQKGRTVKRGEVVGYMGTTGDSTGVHLHFEYWICPANYTYYYGDRASYAVNPLNYCYLFMDQSVATDSASLITRIIGADLKQNRNQKVHQIEVVGYQLRCRTEASLNSSILGYIDYGIYDILATKDSDDYTWYQIASDKWIAGVTEDVILHLVTNDDTNQILDNYNSFTAPKTDYYYIYLKENETIYFPK